MKPPRKRHLLAASATVAGVAAITIPVTMVLADPADSPQDNKDDSCEITPLSGPDGNKTGSVAAVSSDGKYLAGDADEESVLWHDGEFTKLGTEAQVIDVNSEGVVIGHGDFGNGEDVPWKWTDGEFSELEVPNVDGDRVEPAAINDSGDIVGNSGTAIDDEFNPTVPLKWTADSSEATVLELEEEKGAAHDISQDGKIVGSQHSGEELAARPWLWSDEGAGEELPATPEDEEDGSAVPDRISGNFVLSSLGGADNAYYIWDLDKGEVNDKPLQMHTPNGVDEQGRSYGEDFEESEVTYAATESDKGVENLPILKDEGELGEGDQNSVNAGSDDGTVLAGSATAKDSLANRAVVWTGCS